ncbi:hypothetical protein F5X96DRAFT_637187 [Biscogniauxia mediterranea]|nr:hypothetical protein F5X96DRAFT_637187 [Biscogniauxia mediterranea]
MRLRLVVRRNGLPEARLMWNVQLENDPTIANLLEQLNEDVPLEGGQWGLEDYVVELHDSDGTSFECLHYQPVRNVLNTDDTVFVRALNKDDSRRRRISGRYQISSDGRRLIDGVPFGRHRLRASGRPPIYIPPRKRPRLTREDEDRDDDNDTPMLLLTERATNQQDPHRVRFDTGVEDADSEDGEFEGDDQPLDETTSQQSAPDEDMDSRHSDDEDDMDSPDEEDLAQELRELEEENAGFNQGEAQPDPSPEKQTLDLTALDKLTALQAAFPSAPVDICEKILMACGGDLKTTYGHLVDGFEPKLSESALLDWPNVDKPSKPSDPPPQISSSLRSRSKQVDKPVEDAGITDEAEGEEGHNDAVPDFVSQYDYRGLPPGSITSGKGLVEMAAIAAREQNNNSNNEGETASAMLNDIKSSSKEAIEESEDTTSSSGTSSSSESEESEDDSDDEDMSLSDSSSDSDSDSDDSHHSDPENGLGESENHESSDSSSDSDEDSHDSDSGPEEVSIGKSRADISNKLRRSQNRDENSDNSSDEESESSSSSSSESASSEDESSLATGRKDIPPTASTGLQSTRKLHEQTNKADQSVASSVQPAPSVPVPPGAGKESTKSRNARRRLAKKAKKLAQETGMADPTTTMTIGGAEAASHETAQKESLFEAKRRELLEAIANGGIEVGPGSKIDSGDSGMSKVTSKRKREDQQDLQCQDQSEPHSSTPKETTPDEEDASTISAQKRRRIDLGVGRRLVFGALGLRNPKSKKDEDQIRDKLMEDVRPVVNPRLEKDNADAEVPGQIDHSAVEEDPDLWKTKINYRAVECCQEGIELSEPPFPFVQRWDSQQQGFWPSKKNKRGGRNKRAQRNQAAYYGDDTRSKKKHDLSEEWGGEGYDVTFNGIEDTHNTDNIVLNYDDEVPQDQVMNDDAKHSSQNVEMEDLPPVPLDPSVLPTLRPGEARVGMVITWQKWSCSAATNWQPQISNVSAVVVDVKDDGAELRVCLAKRDRYLDGNPKQYDPYTGQRVYGRFEAPDLDEDDEEAEEDDEGYRTLNFSEMQDPRVLQQPLDATDDAGITKPVQSTEASREGHDYQDPTTAPKPSERKATHTADTDKPSPVRASEERIGSANRLGSETTSNIPSHQPGQGQQSAKPSISDFSHLESPSRQLHETASEAFSALSQDHYTIEVARTGSDLDAEPRDSAQDIPDAGTFSAGKSSSANFEIEDENEVIVGTPKVIHHRLAAPSVASSVQSGRQPDYDIGVHDEPASFRVTEDGISTVLGENRSSIGPEDMTTPIPTPAPEARTPSKEKENNEASVIKSSPGNPSTPGSLCSLNSVWCTAVTSRKTQSPSKSQAQALSIAPSQSSRALRDLAYEDAMRKLDELSDDAQDSLKEDADQSLDPNDPEWMDEGGGSDDEHDVVIKSSPHSPRPLLAARISPPPRRRRSTRQSSQFSLPAGAQVFELSSDSDSVILESYPDDEVDGTYSPKSEGLPKGDGWVKKKNKKKGVSLSQATRISTTPSASQPLPPRSGRRYLSASQGHVSSSVPPVNLISSIRQKSRNKLSARF